MSLKSWLDTIDKFAPRCPQCSRKMRNQVTCPACGQVSCSQNCHQRHVKSAHPVLVEEQKQAKKDFQQANKLLANLKRKEAERKELLEAAKKELEHLKKQKAEAAIAKQKELDELQEAEDAAIAQEKERERKIEEAEIAKEETLWPVAKVLQHVLLTQVLIVV